MKQKAKKYLREKLDHQDFDGKIYYGKNGEKIINLVDLLQGFAREQVKAKLEEAAERVTLNWISVEDKLPEAKLGSAYKHSEVVAVLTTHELYPTTARLEVFDDGISQWYDILIDHDVEVTHWLPLPETPRE